MLLKRLVFLKILVGRFLLFGLIRLNCNGMIVGFDDF